MMFVGVATGVKYEVKDNISELSSGSRFQGVSLHPHF